MKNLAGAIAYLNTIKNRNQLNYAQRVFAYYRDYGTPLQAGVPHHSTYGLSSNVECRISNTIRYYMVGDCDVKGHLIDANGKRV